LLDFTKLFFFGFIIDVLYVLWFIAVADRKKITAGILSVGIYAPGIFGTIAVFEDRWAAVPYLSGAFFGVIAGMYIDDWLKSRNERKVARVLEEERLARNERWKL